MWTIAATMILVAAPAPQAKASITKIETADYSFDYSYPAAAAQFAPLAAWLNADRAKARATVARDSAADRGERKKGDFPFHKYTADTIWKVVTETPRLLSLSAETYDFTGGAHGSPGFRSLVWDKRAARRIDPTAVFVSPAAIAAALRVPFCRALDAARESRRGTPVVRNGDSFNACPGVGETTLILGSRSGRSIDRIGLLVGPYVAGPYAEGSYDLTLPVTPAVLKAVKPAYRDTFALSR